MSLRSRVLSGMFWLGGMRLLGQVLTWAITIVVIRHLSPGDYGLLAMATLFMTFLALAAEAGLGPALVQAPQFDDLMLRRIFGAAIAINFFLFALQYMGAPLIAQFFDEERLTVIVRVMGLHFLIAAFGLIPESMLQRRLEFKGQSLIGLGATLIGGMSTLLLAMAGYGVWALVIGSLATRFFMTVFFNMVAPFLKWPQFSFKGMRGLVLFGGQITAARVLYFLYSQADIFIAGRMLGKELLGFYSVSLHLASLPVQKISSIVNTIAFPAFAEAQRNPETIPRHVLKAFRMLSFFSFPVLWGISSIAPEIVTVVLGPRWGAAVLPLQLLPLVMPINMLSPFLNSAFQGIGQIEVVLRNVATAALIMATAFWIGAHWGLLGLSLAWLIGFPLAFLLNLRRMLPLIGLKPADVLRTAALPALAAGCMYACVAGVRYFAAASLPPPALMAVLVLAGAATYTIITLAINRKMVREVFDLFRKGSPGSKDSGT